MSAPATPKLAAAEVVAATEVHDRIELGAHDKHQLSEAMERHVSEFDLAAYTKEDFTLSMQKNIMRRVFNVFDVQQKGSIDEAGVRGICEYLGRPLTVKEPLTRFRGELVGSASFDAFWKWWLKHHDETTIGREAFAHLAVDFAVPYHQQQLFTVEEGEKYTPNFRVKFFFRDLETTEVKTVSPWHDIPLTVRDIVRTLPTDQKTNRYNFVCEIPKWTRAKFEIATGEAYNPIKQDMKNGVPRFYKHGDMMWNYGAFPQTWESTDVEFLAGVKGDNDPLDCIEIGMTQLKTGSVTPVKVIGVLGMIDDGQMDWKVIVIAAGDPIERFINDIDDVPKFLPGCLDSIREWLRVYKICQGGVENHFAFNGEYRDRDFAMKVIDESHLMWGNLHKVNKTSYF